MRKEWLHHPGITHLAVLGSCLALGAALVLAQDASKSPLPAKDSQPGAKPAPAAAPVAQAPPAATRREAKVENRDIKAANRDAKHARRRPITLGVQVQAPSNQAGGNQGLQVSALEENSLAAKAGLQANDRIISVDGRMFASSRQLDAYLASQGGRRIPIVYDRGGQRSTVFVTPTPVGHDTAWLGVFLEEGDASSGDTGAKGARITHIYPSGPAARAGLVAGDMITQIDDRKIEGSHDVIQFVQESEPNAQTQFLVLRNDQELRIPVALGSREHFLPPPAQNGQYQNGQAPDVQNGHASGQQQPQADDDYEDVPPHAMHLEHDRRIAEQHQRIEQELQALREEIRQLREELKKK
jgi:predicted metalloprotease with PDZ domain